MPANTGGWFGRLGVVYHSATRKYVLVAQGGGGLYFATSDTPNGTFAFNNVQTNLPGIVNGSTGDQTTFQDDDGQAYLDQLEQHRARQSLRLSVTRLGLPGGRDRREDLPGSRSRRQLHVQARRHVLLLLVGPARLERLAELLRVGDEHHGPVFGGVRHGRNRAPTSAM